MNPVQRVEALLAQRNLRGLARALKDRNTLVRRRAAQALGELGDPAAVPLLERAIWKDGDQYVQQWAIEALRTIGGPTATDALTAILFGADRRLAALAGQALAYLNTPQAITALRLREALIRNDWAAISALGTEVHRPLSTLLRSDLYRGWPSAKRKEVLKLSVELGAIPLRHHRRDLAAMGLFISEVHTIGDLLAGLRHRNPAVRVAAADKLGASGRIWTARPLFRCFRREMRSGGDRSVAIATARAMSMLGDERAISSLMERLSHPDNRVTADAARTLVEIGTPKTLERLFWFVATPASPAHQSIPTVLAALEAGGPQVVTALRHLVEHEQPRVRRLMIELIARSRYPDGAALLAPLGKDPDPDVQRAALDALAELNTSAAADVLYGLRDTAPTHWIIRALTAMSTSRATLLLRSLDPSATTLRGTVLEDQRPLAGASVQAIQERFVERKAQWDWRAISRRAETDAAGAFALTLFVMEPGKPIRLKVTTPLQPDGAGGEVFTAEIALIHGRDHRVWANIDRFIKRMMVDMQVAEGETVLR